MMASLARWRTARDTASSRCSAACSRSAAARSNHGTTDSTARRTRRSTPRSAIGAVRCAAAAFTAELQRQLRHGGAQLLVLGPRLEQLRDHGPVQPPWHPPLPDQANADDNDREQEEREPAEIGELLTERGVDRHSRQPRGDAAAGLVGKEESTSPAHDQARCTRHGTQRRPTGRSAVSVRCASRPSRPGPNPGPNRVASCHVGSCRVASADRGVGVTYGARTHNLWSHNPMPSRTNQPVRDPLRDPIASRTPTASRCCSGTT